MPTPINLKQQICLITLFEMKSMLIYDSLSIGKEVRKAQLIYVFPASNLSPRSSFQIYHKGHLD